MKREIIESLEIRRKEDGTCVSFTFLEDGEYKTIIDNDYEIVVKMKSPQDSELPTN